MGGAKEIGGERKERRKKQENLEKKKPLSFVPLARQLDRVPLHVPDPGDQAVVLLGERVLQRVAALVEERLDLFDFFFFRNELSSFVFFFVSLSHTKVQKPRKKKHLLTSRNVISDGLSPTGGVELRTM